MASDLSFVEFAAEQMALGGEIRFRKMFGEYGLYCDDIFMSLICEDKLFIKPTDAGLAFVGNAKMAPPYDGAKSHILIEEKLEDKEWLGELVKLTTKDLIKNGAKRKNK